MIKTKTNRGFSKILFKDENRVECSIQKSSSACDMIWMGCEDADPKYFVPNGNPSWKKLEVPETALFTTRMHLTQEQVKEMIPILEKFVESGEID